MNLLPHLKPSRSLDALPLLLAGMLALASGIVVALLTWTLLFPDDPTIGAVDTQRAATSTADGTIDAVAVLLDSSPFGEESADTSTPEVTESTLAIRLRGIIAGRAPLAMIEVPGGVEVRQTGEAISGGVVIHAIESNRILVDNDGRLESISLPDSDDIALDGDNAPPVESLTTRALLEDPERLFDLVNVAAQRRDGRVIGYRVNARPGRETLLTRVGLEDADILTHVAGAPLADPGNMARMMDRLSRGGAIDVRIERNGKPMQTTIDTGALQ